MNGVTRVVDDVAMAHTGIMCWNHRNPYVFRGLIYCAACDRRMQGQYNHGDAYYRCRFPQEYALANQIPHPRNAHRRTTLA